MGRSRLTTRIFAHTLFWSPAAFVVVCVLASIAVDLYGKPPTSGVPSAERAWCLRMLVSLRDELVREATTASDPRAPVAVRDRWTTVQEGYAARLRDAGGRCRSISNDEMRAGYDALERMHARYRTALSELHETVAGPQRDLDRTLQEVGGIR